VTIPTPIEIDDATLAFPACALDFMPKWEDIPDKFKGNGIDDGIMWVQFSDTWFAHGLSGTYTGFIPVEGIDPERATRQLAAIQGSYAPKHEHKRAAVAYLCSLWFVWVAYGSKGVESKREDVVVATDDGNIGDEFLDEWLASLSGEGS
jgi:hypothetical protein